MRRGIGEQSPDDGEPGPADAVGEEAVMADAVEAVGQAVEQEAADELVRRQRHGARCIAVAVNAFSRPCHRMVALAARAWAAAQQAHPKSKMQLK